MPSPHYAILECDTPLANVAPIHGSYGDQFIRLFNIAADLERVKLEFSKWDVLDRQQYPELDKVDGIILTGSRHSSFEDTPWIVKLVNWLRRAMDSPSNKKVVGICFGHQIAARALGAKVDRNPKGWEIAVTRTKLTSLGRQLFPNSNNETLHLQQMHRDAVLDVPSGAEVICSNQACAIQGFYIRHRLLSVQGHPEFVADVVAKIIVSRKEQKIIPEEVADEALKRVDDQNDGVTIARGAIRFFMDESL